MDDVEQLLKGTAAELEKLLNAKNVLGDPIERDGATVYPIVSYGFGFGSGGGAGAGEKRSSGVGAGGGIKPLGAIIIDADGARVEGVHGAASEMIGAIGKAAEKAIDKAADLAGRGRSEA